METKRFQALVVEEVKPKEFSRSIQERAVTDLPEGDLLIRVKYSSLNYKDALSATGSPGVTRNYPHTPGIDGAGVVEKSQSTLFSKGDQVIVTSYDLGMNTAGGFGQYIRVPAEWVVTLPTKLSLEESMILGTAGFTAAMSVAKITAGVDKSQGPILVTGATGGVGSLACAILAKLGYEIAAVSGKPDTGFLEKLGVRKIITRNAFLENTKPPMLKTKWAGVVDTVGGEILATAIKSTMPRGVITCCGNVASPDLPINVFPFILRGVTLFGIDSQHCSMDLRKKLWHQLSLEWKPDDLASLAEKIGLDSLNHRIDLILEGKISGRTLVELG